MSDIKTPDLSATIERLIKEQQLIEETLTETQLAEAIRQALLSGDFVKLIMQRSGVSYHDQRYTHSITQQIIYQPFAGYERLRNKVEKLTKLLEANGIEIPKSNYEL